SQNNAKTLFLLDFFALHFLLINQMLAVFLLTSKWYIVAPHFGVGYNKKCAAIIQLVVIATPQIGVGYIPL
ncbi:MAG: hypothetical protein IJ881_08875, partial [Neisseriaceae bacterium]|nr:hypothetical protein [Neisseriaceae bacterium]